MSEMMNGDLAGMLGASSPDLGGMVSKLLANPELVSQIAAAVGATGEPSAEMSERAEKAEKAENAAETPLAATDAGVAPMGQLMSLLGGMNGGSKDAARRQALLAALKPYCNEHRCRTIDYMIGISKIAGGISGFSK